MSKKILEEIRKTGFSLEQLAGQYPDIYMLDNVPQNEEYHAEGDVLTHTGLVCQNLIELPEWKELEGKEQEVLFLAAVFHDIGKAFCTKLQDGKWASPKHTIIGEKKFRGIIYRNIENYGLTWEEREYIAKLIRYHGTPIWSWAKRRPEFDLLKASESISMKMLYILSKADAKGRIGNGKEKMIERVELFAEYAKELGIWEKPYTFVDAYTKYQYFHREDMWQGAVLYNDTTFDVILMSGLPLAGKDTWIERQQLGFPVVSLDKIRQDLKILPSKKSDKVVQAAMEQAKKYLRKKEPFIWNATNLVQETRQRLVQFFSNYGARVHIVYLEAPYKELKARNQVRERYIPEQVLEEMIDKLEIPAPWESYEVKADFNEKRDK